MSSDLVVRKNMDLSFDEMTRAAKAMAMSGYFNDAKDVSQAMVKVMAGQEMGLGPFAAMANIHVIKGKPVLGANLIATLIKNDSRYDYKVKRLDNEAAVLEFYENGALVGESSFTIEEARTAGVGSTTPPGKNKTMLQMYARNMLFSRAISNGAKWYTPGIFGGNAVYTPDELGADEDQDGNIINITPSVVDTETGEVVEDETEAEAKSTNGNGRNAKAPKPDPLAQAIDRVRKSGRNFFPALADVTGWEQGDLKEAAKTLGMEKIHGDERRLAQFRTVHEYAQLVEEGIEGGLAIAVVNDAITREEAIAQMEDLNEVIDEEE